MPFSDEHANALKKRQARMPFVDMYCPRGQFRAPPARTCRPFPARFLAEAAARIPSCKVDWQSPGPRADSFDIGVQQIDGNAANIRLPDENVNRRIEQGHLNHERRIVFVEHRSNRIPGAIQHVLLILLPAIVSKLLRNVAAGIDQPYSDDRNGEVAALLDVVPG